MVWNSNGEEEQQLSKKERSEAARAASIRAKAAEAKRKSESLIGGGFGGAENVPKAKKIVFASDDEDEEKEKEKASGSKRKGEEEEREDKKKRPKLFDEDGEDEEGGGGGEEEILIRNRHSGVKGAELMRREARFGNDERFRMGASFLEQGEEEEGEEEDEGDLEAEKRAHMDVLSRVLGKDLQKAKKGKENERGEMVGGAEKKGKKEKGAARPFTRFDPDNPEHVEWMTNQSKDKEKKKMKEDEGAVDEEEEEGEGEKEEDATPESRRIEGRFFEMKSSLAEELKANGGLAEEKKPFSFLSAIGRAVEEEKGKEGKEKEKAMEEDEKEEKEQNGGETARETKKDRPVLQEVHYGGAFFISTLEPRIKSVVANFRRTQSMEKVKAGWAAHRESIIKIYKHQRRYALKMEKDANKGYNYNRNGKAGGGGVKGGHHLNNKKTDRKQPRHHHGNQGGNKRKAQADF